jgi:putative ABC transport system permease protein
MVFFIFANFISHPQVESVDIMGGTGAMASRVMYLCEIVIIIFTMVFATYSISSFLKSREKEFGLLSMFGLTNAQIRSYMMFENIVVSSMAIMTGVILGIFFSKLFFLAVSAILDLGMELPLIISLKATLLTMIGFIMLFQGIGFIVSYKIKNKNIIELLKGARIPKPVPRFSKGKAIIAVILIAAGYILAVFSGLAILFTMLPILILAVSGTYLLYSQFSVFFTDKLQKNKSIYYNGSNFIILSQIIFKLRDNAKILFIASILSAVTLTASVSVYSMEKSILGSMRENFPQDFNFLQRGINLRSAVSNEQIEEIIRTNGHEIQYKNRIVLIEAVNKNGDISNSTTNKKDFYIMSNSDYNLMASQFGKKQVHLSKEEMLIHTYNITGRMGTKYFADDNKNLMLSVDKRELQLRIKDEISGGIINSDEKSSNIAVVNDEVFNEVLKGIDSNNRVVYYGYNLKDWTNALDSVEQINSMFLNSSNNSFSDRVQKYLPIIRGMSLILFIGTFISILFFISTSSILYFKIYNEIQGDRQEFIALKKLGVSRGEIKKIIGTQCAILFLLPYLAAVCHSIFAIKALGNLLQDTLSVYFIVIAGIYLMLQLIYLIAARAIYNKQINTWIK